MLGSLPKLADRSFILGFFLPSLLFGCVVLLLLSDHPGMQHILDHLADEEPGDAILAVIGIWTLSVLMLTLNHPLYRLLEGYLWPFSRLTKHREHYRGELKKISAELGTLGAKYRRMEHTFPADQLARYRSLRMRLMRYMPTREGDVMPTAFGNAIKSFEVYPRDVYGADGVTLWLRLASVVPKEFMEEVQNQRSQVDFLVNSCLFAAVVGVIAFGEAVWQVLWARLDAVSLPDLAGGLGFLGCSGLALLLSWALYRWAIERVVPWGDLVKTAFDCYLPALASKLGFALPPTRAERMKFWTSLSQTLIYGSDVDGAVPFAPEHWKQIESTNAPADPEEAAPDDDEEEET